MQSIMYTHVVCICMCSPYVIYLDHRLVFVLTSTVVCIQIDDRFSKTVLVKEMVDEADDCVGTLARHKTLINEVIDLIL